MNVSEFTVVYCGRDDGWLIGFVEELPSISAMGEQMSDVRDALVRLLQERLRANRAEIAEEMKGRTVVRRERVRPEAPNACIAVPGGNTSLQRAAIHRQHPHVRTPFTAVHVQSSRKGAPIVSFVPEVRGALSEAATTTEAEERLQKAVALVLASQFDTESASWFHSETAGEEVRVLGAAPLPFRWPGEGESS